MASLALMLPRAVRKEVEDPQSVLHRLRPESGLVGGRAEVQVDRAVSRGARLLWALPASLGSKLKFLGLNQPDNWLDQSHSISEATGPVVAAGACDFHQHMAKPSLPIFVCLPRVTPSPLGSQEKE